MNTNELIINYLKQNLDKKISVNISCGKDSIVLLQWCMDNIDCLKINYDINFVLAHELDWNDLELYCYYLENFFSKKINIIKISLNDDSKLKNKFMEYAKKHVGVPSLLRYCQSFLKGQPLDKLKYNITIEGLRWDESNKRATYKIIEKKNNRVSIRPILYFSKTEIYNTIRKIKIKLHWNYKYFTRLSCALCPLSLISLSVNSQSIALHKYFDYNLYKEWFNNICLHPRTSIKFKKNWEFLQNNKDSIILKQNYNENLDFWYPSETII